MTSIVVAGWVPGGRVRLPSPTRVLAVLVVLALTAEAGALVGTLRARRAPAPVVLSSARGPSVPPAAVAARLALMRRPAPTLAPTPPPSVATLPPAPTPSAPVRVVARPPSPGPARVLACIRRWESEGSGGYRAVSPSGTYRGAYQVDRAFWLTHGGDPRWAGRPDDRSTWRWELAPPAEQDAVAARGYAARDLRPWPVPARRCR